MSPSTATLSTPQYPVYDAPPGASPEPGVTLPAPAGRDEDPPWSGWDVLGIAFLTILSIFFFLFLTALAAKLVFFRQHPPPPVGIETTGTGVARVVSLL